MPDLRRHTPGAFGAPMYGWGQAFSWATLVLAWLMAFAIGIAIYFFANSAVTR